jgi:two-component system, OmpR family, sensor kinase
VVRSDDASMIGVYQPNRPGFPWHFVVPIGIGVLVVVGAASLWFSRRLVRPLGELAEAARKFGSGDTRARARLHRDDELGDVGRAFDDMAGRTEALLLAQRQLMADVSHELRTPLARIRVALELVAEDPVAAKDVLAEVGGDLDEIDQLIEDILTTARLDGEQAELRRQSISVAEVARCAIAGFAARHPGRRLEPALGAEVAIECDPALLRRALDNLLDNAANYSEPTSAVTLALVGDPAGAARAVAFEVVDHGIGMTAEELERAFTPFWRADASRARRTGGVGLGLALARRIARAHGGDVTLVSVPGRGTTARLALPTARGGS